jgi:hypothetical protein
MKTYNKKNVLAIFTGIIVTGLILNTVYELTPKEIVGIDNQRFEKEYKQDQEYIQNTPQEETILEEAVTIDPVEIENQRKIDNVRKFLEKRNSPLAEYAHEFVYAANEYGIDYRLVAAISIVESSGGLVNFRPYNAWGWGKSGFENWKDGIWSVSKGLGNYYAKGLDTPYEIGRVYCPPSADSWAGKVTYLTKQIGEPI